MNKIFCYLVIAALLLVSLAIAQEVPEFVEDTTSIEPTYSEETDTQTIQGIRNAEFKSIPAEEVKESAASNIVITINSPSSWLISNKNVPFNITTNVHVENITFIDETTQPDRELILCQGGNACDLGYGNKSKKAIAFDDGSHKVRITARSKSTIPAVKYVSFTVDSKAPKKISQTPKSSGYTNGSINLFYVEANPFYKINDIDYFRDYVLSFKINDVTIGKYNYGYSWGYLPNQKVNATFKYNLASKNNQKISYSITIKDIANHTMTVSANNILVDTILPQFNFTPYYDVQKRRFNISVSEKVTLTYQDYSDMTWYSLCKKCLGSTKNMPFGPGDHTLKILAVDPAGNRVEQEISFPVP
jgi:hypothetical protein